MTSENAPAVAGKTAAMILRENGEIAARTIIALWKGPDLADACHAALELGHMNSVNLLPYHRCRELLDRELELHKVNKDHWPMLSAFFTKDATPSFTVAKSGRDIFRLWLRITITNLKSRHQGVVTRLRHLPIPVVLLANSLTGSYRHPVALPANLLCRR